MRSLLGAVLAVLLTMSCADPAVNARRPGILKLNPADAIQVPTPGDLGRIFASVDEAAIAACEWLWEHEPAARQAEFCGVIFQGVDGLRAGLPVTRGNPGTCTTPLVPPNTKLAGKFHNHLLTEDFSEIDRQTRLAVAQYLWSPSKGVCSSSR